MTDFNAMLAKASVKGIISTEQQAQLEALIAPETGTSSVDQSVLGLEQSKDIEDRNAGEASEAPRLIRGFHDVLITIGILIALGGLWTLGTAFAVIPAVVILAEIFVRRQNLALPAFVLTLMLAAAVQVSMTAILDFSESPVLMSGVFLAQVVALGLFYWRYQIPVALAVLTISVFWVAFFLVLSIYQGAMGTTILLEDHAQFVGVLGSVLSAGLFVVALRFDFQDRIRVTRRSDVAFWLHLTTAPLLLYSMFLVIFGSDGFWWSSNPTAGDAIIAVLLITIMILVGIIIDRRAFVTSGLLSLGVALYTITASVGITLSSIGAFSFLAVGIIVLLLGTGWNFLRKSLVQNLPDNWQAALPPV